MQSNTLRIGMSPSTQNKKPILGWALCLALFACLLAAPTRAQDAPFDLIPTAFDDNGNPLNPDWRTHNPDPSKCPGFPWKTAWQPPCTSQSTRINEQWCAGNGHANWLVATYTGELTWSQHSHPLADDDYCLYLKTPGDVGRTVNNGNSGIEIEFAADETVNRFSTRWWTELRAIADSGTARRNAHGLVDGKHAIVTGLVGLDFAHNSGSTELHPVYAMAVRIEEHYFDKQWPIADEEMWTFFVRNWGNEGYCSRDMEATPQTQFTFRFPWPKRAGAARLMTGIPDYYIARNHVGPTWSWQDLPAEKASLLTVNIRGPERGDLVHGQIKILFDPSPGLPDHGVSPQAAERYARDVKMKRKKRDAQMHAEAWAKYGARTKGRELDEDTEPEKRLAEIIRGLPPEKRNTLVRLLPQKKWPAERDPAPELKPPAPIIKRKVEAGMTIPNPEFLAKAARRDAVLREILGRDYPSNILNSPHE